MPTIEICLHENNVPKHGKLVDTVSSNVRHFKGVQRTVCHLTVIGLRLTVTLYDDITAGLLVNVSADELNHTV